MEGVTEEDERLYGTEDSQDTHDDGKKRELMRKVFHLQALNHGLVNPMNSQSTPGRSEANRKKNVIKLEPSYSAMPESKDISSSSSQNLDSQTQILRSTIKEYSDELNWFR